MDKFSTKELTKALITREGVMALTIKPYESIKIKAGQEEFESTGPAIILINQD